MSKRIKTVLCFFGVHEWVTFNFGARSCTCGKAQRLLHDPERPEMNIWVP